MVVEREKSGKEQKEAEDLILDIQFDHSGTRFATACADRHIRVYKRKENGEFEVEYCWVAHAATIWHLDWAHPYHGTILASCSFDKCLKIWIPPDSGALGGRDDRGKGSSVWQEIDKHSVDKRGAVTDVRFSPVWFNARSEVDDEDFGGSSKVYIACCTSDGQAKIYQASTPVSKSKKFDEERSLTIIRNGNNSNFRCTTLDWSRLRHKDQLIAIGSEGSNLREGKNATKEPLIRLYKFCRATRDNEENSSAETWKLLERQSREISTFSQASEKEIDGPKTIEGPINLLRFSANMGTNVHLVAIAARNIHIATIDPANDFKIQHMNVIPPHESLLLNHEKCWRLCWDMSTMRLFSAHGEKVFAWTRSHSDNEWVSQSVES